MLRASYSSTVREFLQLSDEEILGKLTRSFSLGFGWDIKLEQLSAWVEQIKILKAELLKHSDGKIFFEAAIPRFGKQADNILYILGVVFIFEFKVGQNEYPKSAINQVMDYALDIKYFHKSSHNIPIIPVLVCTKANTISNGLEIHSDKVYNVLKSNGSDIASIISSILKQTNNLNDVENWEKGEYHPTPTIIEAANSLFNNQNVNEISRSDAEAENLSVTTETVLDLIQQAKAQKEKHICFITGVPGSGKTLAGLKIVHDARVKDTDDAAVFLSGNGPLVKVLREALRINALENNRGTRADVKVSVESFIQNIHHFRDNERDSKKPPVEKIVVFDEAQRAWNREKTSSFMSKKRGVANFNRSEPDFLMSILDRHNDWAFVICLVGGGQEIHDGEAGIQEWFNSIEKNYAHWHISASERIIEGDYLKINDLEDIKRKTRFSCNDALHLKTSLRSFRSENVSKLINSIISNEIESVRSLYESVKERYKITITRDLNVAKNWLRLNARGNERYGIIASSGGLRLRKYGLHVKNDIDPVDWFLKNRDDVRSSFALEEVATEFDIQGLELDWACIAWDADLRYTSDSWGCMRFRGSSWQNVKSEIQRRYLLNTYRVLLTRARQGMVIFIPEGDLNDLTALPSYYNGTFEMLSEVGFEVLR